MDNNATLKVKNNLYLCDNCLFFKPAINEQVSDFSFQILADLIAKHQLKNDLNNKILISYEGDENTYKTVNLLNFLLTKKGYTIYNFDAKFGVNISLDEIALKMHNLDLIIKIITCKNDPNSKVIYLYDSSLNYVPTHMLFNIFKEYRETNPNDYKPLNYDDNFKVEMLKTKDLIDLQASKEEILKAFANVKPRYKSKNIIISNNEYANFLISKLLRNYDSDFLLKKDSNLTKFWLWWFKKFHRQTYEHSHNQGIFHVDNLSNFSYNLFLNRKIVNLNINEIVMIYLDFLIEEIKRSKTKDINDLFVVISPNSSYKITEILRQYNVKYYYYDNRQIDRLLNDKNCLFAVSFDKINANPRYSKIPNNYFFFICLTWMLNSYTNRNNLLSFKYNKLIENFGEIVYKQKRYKFKNKNIPPLIKNITKKHKTFKHIFEELKVFDFSSLEKYVILKLTSYKRHAVILSYCPLREELIVDFQMCSQYGQNDIPWKTEYRKIKKLLEKIINGIQYSNSEKTNPNKNN